MELKNLEKETSDNYRIETFSRPFSYISKGLYARQLQIWFDLFPKENILITSTEEMAFNPQHFMNKIFDFLNISKYDKTILQPNVTFHMIAVMQFGDWGVEASEAIRVTENGSELFCNMSKELYIKSK